MPQFLLSVHHPERSEPLPLEVTQRMFALVGAFNEELNAANAFVFANGLEPPSAARVVRPSGLGTSTTDGPFHASDQLGGFWIIEAADIEAATQWAVKGATACGEVVQVRQFRDHS